MVDPSDGEAFAEIARGGADDVDRAVASARGAYESHWGRTPAFERGRLLRRLGERVEACGEELAALESRDTGKPLKQARVDAAVAARYFEFYAGAADKLHGDTLPFLDGYQVVTLREPFGVTGHIIPWNYPLQMGARTMAAALAAGNALVLKPAEEACLTVLRLAELALAAGLPADVVNIVTGYGEEAGAALAAHGDVDHVSFTGSPEVGTLVQQAAARRNAGCTMELGGKSPQIVFADADFDAAVPVIVNAIIQNAGQTCSAGSRLLVEDRAYDAFMGLVAERFGGLRAGAAARDLDCGPLISATQKTRVEGYVEGARASFSGGAGLLSTTADYTHFLEALRRGGPILGRKSVELMTVNHLPADMASLLPGTGFGLGFAVASDLGASGQPGSVGEYSWGGAYHTRYWVDPVEELTVVYMTQVLPAPGLDDFAKVRALIYQAVE